MARGSQGPAHLVGRKVGARRRAWRTILEFQGAVTSLLDQELRDGTEVDLQTYDALLHIYEAGEAGIRMSDLASRVLLSRSGLTSVVDRLEQRGLAQRITDPKDRRATRITLTEGGVDTFLSAAEVHVAGIKRYVADRMSDAEAKVIAETLARIRGEIRGI